MRELTIQDGDDRFLAVVGEYRELDFALLDMEDGVRRVRLARKPFPLSTLRSFFLCQPSPGRS